MAEISVVQQVALFLDSEDSVSLKSSSESASASTEYGLEESTIVVAAPAAELLGAYHFLTSLQKAN